MLAGKPNPQTFPFQSIAFTLKPPLPSGETDVNPSVPEVLDMSGEELDAALQYGPTAGMPAFLSWITDLQTLSHHRGDPKQEGWRCSIGTGSQELMYKVTLLGHPDNFDEAQR